MPFLGKTLRELMSNEEVINEIISEPKYYIGVINQSTASRTIKRFRDGTITLNKLNEFIAKFGYVKRSEGWVKTKMHLGNYQTK